LFVLLLLFSLIVIDEDQKHIGDDASMRFIPSSANTVHQPLKRANARRMMSRLRLHHRRVFGLASS
jgi:hypothetical protein